MEKFAEDERLEQMNAQKRRLREAEHKRDVEELWQQKLVLYQAEKQRELDEMMAKQAEEARLKQLIEEEKARMFAEHEAILRQHYPKVVPKYTK